MIRLFSVFLSMVILVFSCALLYAYETVEVDNGATIKGLVTFKGDVPDDEAIIIDKDIDYCGEKIKAGKYVISNSNVKNAVVWIEGIDKGKVVSKKDVKIKLKDCVAKPLVNIGFVGSRYIIRNEDDILHTVQLKLGLKYHEKASQRPLESGATIYNLAFPRKGIEIKKRIKGYHKYSEDKGYVYIKSNVHNCIRGYVFIFDHPYAAVTDERGAFTMDSLPPGDYTLKVWHEGFGIQERKLKVTSGEIKEIEVEFLIEGATSQNHKGDPTIKFSKKKYNFGNVKKGEIVSHDFEFVNEGDGSLQIVELIPA